jgi:hypothetical protein
MEAGADRAHRRPDRTARRPSRPEPAHFRRQRLPDLLVAGQRCGLAEGDRPGRIAIGVLLAEPYPDRIRKRLREHLAQRFPAGSDVVLYQEAQGERIDDGARAHRLNDAVDQPIDHGGLHGGHYNEP